jgi:AraC-like DNA-binding protein/ligand-binding sensor protein
MADYLINTNEMNRIFALLNGVLKIRITFFDSQGSEVKALNIQESSPFCRMLRCDTHFNKLCCECDRKNLEICQAKHDVHVYYCHAGLLEGIVPLYKSDNTYLGAIFFGQVRDPEKPLSEEFSTLAGELQCSTMLDMYKTGTLLKYLGEYICENELIKRCSQPWTTLFEDYVTSHLNQPITLQDAARVLNRSVSFVAHNVPLEFGMPLKKYVREKRMQKAAEMLAQGKLVRECAFELGYKDEFYFSRDFKKYFGSAPKYKRKKQQ